MHPNALRRPSLIRPPNPHEGTCPTVDAIFLCNTGFRSRSMEPAIVHGEKGRSNVGVV
jgi:hypothetical protein